MARQPDRLTAIVEWVASHDVPVEWEGGWRTHGGRRFAPQAATFHHDASPPGSDIRHVIRDGHSRLSGPLANFYPTRSGTLVVIAAGRAHHAGKGGWKGLRGNSSVWGIEIANNGVGEPYGDAQMHVVLLLMRAFVEVDGVPVEFLHSHHEWAPNRKRDPALDPERQSGPWNMDRFRHDVSQQPDPDPDPEDDMAKVRIWHGRAEKGQEKPQFYHVNLLDRTYTLLGREETIDTWTRRVESDGDPDVIGHAEPVDKARPSWFAGLDPSD